MTFRQVAPIVFRRALHAARCSSEIIRNSTSDMSHSDTLTAGTRYFLSPNGQVGYAIRPDGELVYVHSTIKGCGGFIMADAVENGATHLDCFDGYLVDFYARHGFERVTSLPNWTAGEPDVVYMARPGHFLTALDKAERDFAAAS